MRILYTLALVATLAHADGVPLLSARKEAAEDRPAIAKAQAKGAVATPVSIHRYALDSNVITVRIDGKELRFVGGKREVQSVESAGAVTKSDAWSGTTVDEATLTLTRTEGHSLVGSLYTSDRHYELKNNLLIRHSLVVQK